MEYFVQLRSDKPLHQYPWFEKLDRSAIDLGKGKRLIVRGGRYDKEFRITVPERFGAER